MKARTAIGRAALRARLTAAGCCALIILGTAAVSACSGSGSSTPAVSSFTIAGTSTASGTASGSASGSITAGTTSTPASTSHVTTPGTSTSTSTSTSTNTNIPAPVETTSPTESATPSPEPSPSSSSPIPSAPPVTGGGGTAGFQDGLLVLLGVGAILAGAGSIAYRRRLTRNR